MSIGNVKTSGSKGTNYPWQYAMLKTLTAISTSLGAGTEFESRLVRLIAGPYTLYLEVRGITPTIKAQIMRQILKRLQ